MHGTAAAVVIVPTAGIITSDGSLSGGRYVVGTDIAVSFVVAVTAAHRISGAGMVYAHAVQAASAALIMATVRLGTVQIAHFTITSINRMSGP